MQPNDFDILMPFFMQYSLNIYACLGNKPMSHNAYAVGIFKMFPIYISNILYLHTVQSKAKKPKKKPYPLIMHAFCHLDAQTKILRSNFSISTR